MTDRDPTPGLKCGVAADHPTMDGAGSCLLTLTEACPTTDNLSTYSQELICPQSFTLSCTRFHTTACTKPAQPTKYFSSERDKYRHHADQVSWDNRRRPRQIPRFRGLAGGLPFFPPGRSGKLTDLQGPNPHRQGDRAGYRVRLQGMPPPRNISLALSALKRRREEESPHDARARAQFPCLLKSSQPNPMEDEEVC